MEAYNKIKASTSQLRKDMIIGLAFGVLYALAEYLIRVSSEDPVTFVPLLIRGSLLGGVLGVSVGAFEVLLRRRFIQKPFLYLVLVRSFSFTVIIIFWLSLVNGAWLQIDKGMSFTTALENYYGDPSFLINLPTVFMAMVIIVGMTQINSLHRQGELVNFILGKYHQPQEVDRIFCFIDLKGSTGIAESLGNLKFGSFLKDFYSDITEAIRDTKAEIYQYVGDEIILTWTFEEGLKDNHSIQCFFSMQEIIDRLRPRYLEKYGCYPQFKAGLHAGKVLITWVGEIKKEIVYIGDVVNTTSRIQEDCKRLSKDFLISQYLLDRIDNLGPIKASFVDETVPRGKEEKIRLYSLEMR